MVVVVMEVLKVVVMSVLLNMFIVSIVYVKKWIIKMLCSEVGFNSFLFRELLVIFIFSVFIFFNDGVELCLLFLFIKLRLLLCVVMC